MRAMYETLALLLSEGLNEEPGDWTWRGPVDDEPFVLTWWPEGWMKGMAYWIQIKLERVPPEQIEEYLKQRIIGAVMTLKYRKEMAIGK